MDTDKGRVIVVEDDELVRKFLCRALEMGGVNATGAASGEAALAEVRDCTDDLVAVLIDGLLPDMHGSELAERILTETNGGRCGICFVSGALTGRTPIRSGVMGLGKPVRPAELLATLRDLTTWHRGDGDDPADRAAALNAMAERFTIAP